LRRRQPGGQIESGFTERQSSSVDPTDHPTFVVTVARNKYGRAIWSDLSYSQLDAFMPKAERRIVVTVQKAIADSQGTFAGVLRVGLLTRTIDSLPLRRSTEVEPRPLA
jgi:hypothetical protein